MPRARKSSKIKPLVEFLNIRGICELGGFSRPTFKKMEQDFPDPILFGNTKMWRKEVVVKYLLKLGM